MIFTELAYLPLVVFSLIIFALLKNSQRGRLYLIIVASAVFYCWWSPKYYPLMFASIFLDYTVGIMLSKNNNTFFRKILLTFSICGNLGILALFKYSNFFVTNIDASLSILGLPEFFGKTYSIILPVGISFYTFQSMSYTFDVYLGNIKPCFVILCPLLCGALLFISGYSVQSLCGRRKLVMQRLSISNSNSSIKLFYSAVWTFIWALLIYFVIGNSARIRYTLPFYEYRFIRDRILSDTLPISTAFLGSSQTMAGVNPLIADANDTQNSESLNLCIAWHGRDIRYVILRDLLEHRRVKRVVMETSTNEEKADSHKNFGMLARPQDVYKIPFLKLIWPSVFATRNAKWIGDLVLPIFVPPVHFIRSLTLNYLPNWYADEKIEIDKLVLKKGFYPARGSISDTRVVLPSEFSSTSYKEKYLKIIAPSAYRFEWERLQSLCNKYNVELFFLYLPPRGYGDMAPELRMELQRYGTVILPPWKEWQSNIIWRDGFHLNGNGAKLLSSWLRDNVFTEHDATPEDAKL